MATAKKTTKTTEAKTIEAKAAEAKAAESTEADVATDTAEATGPTLASTDTVDISKFDKFRDRAIKSPKSKTGGLVTNDPFVLGPEDGFDRTIKIERPNFAERLNIGIYVQEGDIVGLLQSIFAEHTNYIIYQLNLYEAKTGNVADEIFLGIVMAYLEHFYGKDAASSVFKKLSV